MVSQSRQYHSGYWYHVYARGQRGEPLFFSPGDREQYLSLLDEIFTRQRANLGAYCLMTNHAHVLVRMGPVSLGKILRTLHMRYALYFNRKRSTRGHVFQGRPGVKIVLHDEYLLQLVPCIHRNPVTAGMVGDVSEYPWSSDSIYRSRGDSHREFTCWQFPPGFEGPERVQTYRERLNEPVRDFSADEDYIGTEEEWEALERRKEERKDRFRDRRNRPDKETIALEEAREVGLTLGALRKKGRKQPAASARQKAMARMHDQGYGPVEVGEFFNRSRGSVSHAIRKFSGDD